MWRILVALFLGALVGTFVPFNDLWKKRIGTLQFYGVLLLLFFMGVAIGINPDVINNLQRIGVLSIAFAIATTFFSVMITYFLTRAYLRKQKEAIK